MIAQGILRNRRLVVAAILMLALILVFWLQKYWKPSSPAWTQLSAGAASAICASIAAGFCISTWRSLSSQEAYKKIWGWVTLGVILWAMAEITWEFYEVVLKITVPYPSVADLFWLSGYIPIYVALSIAYRTFQAKSSRQQKTAIIMFAMLFAAASIFFVIVPIVQSFDATKLSKV